MWVRRIHPSKKRWVPALEAAWGRYQHKCTTCISSIAVITHYSIQSTGASGEMRAHVMRMHRAREARPPLLVASLPGPDARAFGSRRDVAAGVFGPPGARQTTPQGREDPVRLSRSWVGPDRVTS